jgi:hypothetical protein
VVDRNADRLAHVPLADQVHALEWIVRSNPIVAGVLGRLPALQLGSCHFDAEDLSEPAENAVQARVTEVLGANGAAFDVTNEARVHTWYEHRFGRPLAPYRSVKHAIATWPTTWPQLAALP